MIETNYQIQRDATFYDDVISVYNKCDRQEDEITTVYLHFVKQKPRSDKIDFDFVARGGDKIDRIGDIMKISGKTPSNEYKKRRRK